MNFSEKLPAFANPQGAAGKLLIASRGFPIWILPVMKKSSTSAAEAASTCPAF